MKTPVLLAVDGPAEEFAPLFVVVYHFMTKLGCSSNQWHFITSSGCSFGVYHFMTKLGCSSHHYHFITELWCGLSLYQYPFITQLWCSSSLYHFYNVTGSYKYCTNINVILMWFKLMVWLINNQDMSDYDVI